MTQSFRRITSFLWLMILPVKLAAAGAIDLKDAVVVAPDALSGAGKKAVTMLVKEVEKRTHIHWQKESAWPAKPASAQPIIAVGSRSQLEAFAGPYASELQSTGATNAEGFRLCIRRANSSGPPAMFVIGNDARGVLFGVGQLLRELHMGRRSLHVCGD